ncbi:hypothetical protein E5163_14840 [Marinicauda algicola]|uniref:Uncharacterized protein n=1 Tax=Marinicauda algicola TaxID=2029849 RepID=A0A4S2GX50_9PROT|nr:hypothetical protein [Marinicauda algicola]TGY87342.1 hypothetical protein E5163_14840 [Marinicauda algicola]
MGNPWMKFYPGDWRADPKLRMCSLQARGLWIEMLALMHEASPYGHLLVNGRRPTDAQLAVLAGAPSDQITDLLGELEAAGVFSRTREGVIYSRRMTRDEKKSATARKNGQKGGNPSVGRKKENPPLDNPPDNPPDKPQKPEARSQKGERADARKPAPITAEHLRQIEQVYPKAGLVNDSPQALLHQVGRASLRLGGIDRLIDSMRRYAAAVDEADTLPKGLRKFLDPAEGLAERYAPPETVNGRTVESWEGELALWRDHGSEDPQMWRRRVGGPNPGEPGCRAPAELQRRFGFDPRPLAVGEGRAA